MIVPAHRGPLSEGLSAALRADDPALLPSVGRTADDTLADDDLQLALWVCFELEYRGFDDVSDGWQCRPELIALRSSLAEQLLAQLRCDVPVPPSSAPVPERVQELVATDTGPPLSRHIQRLATRAQFDEWAMHRSVYQLKEADPHSFAIPRLTGRAKAALVEIQADEYGAGDAGPMHSALYAQLLTELGLDASYGAYVDAVPGITLALSNVMSLFALHRSLRGALVGHLAAYEMTSSIPSRRYARGMRRLAGRDAKTTFFDVHVTADALHEQIALHDLCGGLADAEPEQADDIVFGAAVCLHVEARFGQHLLDSWADGRSSLRVGVGVGDSLARGSSTA